MGLADDFLKDAGVVQPINQGMPRVVDATPEEIAKAAGNLRVEVAGVAPKTSLADQFSADAAAAPKINTPAPIPRDEANRAGMDAAVDRLGNFAYGATKGAADLVQAPAQLMLNSYAKLYSSIPKVGEFLGENANKFNDYLKNQESQYQSDTGDSKTAGMGRIGAGIAPFLLSGGATAPTQAVGAIPHLVQALKTAGIGAGFAAGTQPVNDVTTSMSPSGDLSNDFFKQKSLQAGLGAGGALAGGALGGVAARLVRPNTSSDVTTLLREGITPTPGQIMGGGWAKTEDKLTSVPILGDLIKNAQRRGVEDLNKAAYARALDPINAKSTAPVGREGIAEVKAALGDAYDKLLPKMTFKTDPQFSSEINNLTSMMQNGNVPPEIGKQFDSILKNEVVSRMSKAGTMDGQSFKELESSLSPMIKGFSGSQSQNDRTLGSALGEVLASARGALSRSNPAEAKELAAINEGYANYARIRGAGKMLGAENGVFTPAQLQNAVQSQDKSVGKGAFATGNALMQDLSETGKNVLGSKYPDSGTVGRALVAGLAPAAGAAYLNPVLASAAGIGGAALSAPYTQMGQKLTAALLAKRPAIAAPIAQGIRAGAPLTGAAISPLLLEALKNNPN